MAELSPEQLKDKVVQLEKDLKTSQEGKASAEHALSSAKKVIDDQDRQIKDLSVSLKAALDGKAKAESDLAAAKQVIEDNETRMLELEAGKPQLPIFTVDKEQYELVSPFTWNRKEVTIDELKANPKLAKELIKEGIGLIRKVEK